MPLSGLLFHATGTPAWLLRPVKVSTSSELHPGYFQLPTFLDCLGIQFFYSPLRQPVRLHLATYHSLCSICVTYRTKCHANGHQVLPTQPLSREAKDFPMGGKHLKHVPLIIYLICFSPKRYYMVGSI